MYGARTLTEHPSNVREPPRTKRGERTRQGLIEAARAVFERDGYTDARLIDITTEAGTSAGSFYTYFTNKEEILAAVLEDLQEEMVHPQVERVAGAETPVRIIEAGTRAYLTSYQKNARLMRLLDEVADIDDNFRRLRARRNEAFVQRNARSIRNLQIRGLADPELDPRLAAGALGLMVARVAYRTFVDGEPWELEELVSAMTRLWANALRIPIDSPDA